MATLNVYIINAKPLSIRRDKIKGFVKLVAELYPHMVLPKFITTNDVAEIEPKIQEINGRMLYEPCGDPEFDSALQQIGIENISNIYKHVDVWRSISTNPTAEDSLHLVIEDDVVVMQDNVDNVKRILKYVDDDISGNNMNQDTWDMLFLGLAPPKPANDTADISLNKVFKVLPSKEAYFIKKRVATKLCDEWSNCKITHSLRLQLSKYLFNHPEIKAMYPDIRVTVDGSKLGLYPSTTAGQNILIYNGGFMEMLKIFLKPTDEIKDLFPKVKDHYNNIKSMGSPDVTQIYGMILHKLKRFDEAEEALLLALDQTRKAQGLFNNRCALGQNIVNVYKDLQNDIASLSVNPSKYSIESTLIPLKD
jgi:hypothetical protein